MKLSIDQALSDRKLLGGFMTGDSWGAWRTLWRAAFALPPQPGDLELFKACTGRCKWPKKPSREIWLIIGRRGGKSINVGLVATYTAAFNEFPQLASGEYATIPIISPTRQQSRVVKGFISSFFQDNPFLKRLVVNETAFELSLSNRVQIAIMTADFRSIRGFSCPLVILEEAAFFYQEGNRTDAEAVRAIRPALATLDGILCVISSPFAKSGAVYDAYSRSYGVDGDILIWKAPSKVMNPLLKQDLIDQAMAEDREAAMSEWEADFRSDISSFINPEIIDQCTAWGCHERAPLETNTYFAFTDMAGGSGKDSATLGISHSENGKAILNCIREIRPPFSPEAVVEEFSNTLKNYRIQKVSGDRWAGDWPKERFSLKGIIYEPEERSKSEIYVECLPLFNSGQVELLDIEVLRRQLCALERRTHSGGRQSIDHPISRAGRDDVSNAACGALVRSFERQKAIFNNLNRAEWRVYDRLSNC